MNYKQFSIFCFFSLLYSFTINAQKELYWNTKHLDQYVQIGYDEYCNKSLLTNDGYPVSTTQAITQDENFFKRGDHLYFSAKKQWDIRNASAYWIRSGNELKTLYCKYADTLTNELILAEIQGDYAILDTNGRVTRWIKGADYYSHIFMDQDKLYATSDDQIVEIDETGKPIPLACKGSTEYLGKGYWICMHGGTGNTNSILTTDKESAKVFSLYRHSYQRGSDYLIVYNNPNITMNFSEKGYWEELPSDQLYGFPDRLSLITLETEEILLKDYALIIDLGNHYFLVRGGSKYRLYDAKNRKFSKIDFDDYTNYGITGKIMLKKNGHWGMLDIESGMRPFLPFIHRGNKDYLLHNFGNWMVICHNSYYLGNNAYDFSEVSEDSEIFPTYVYNAEAELIKKLSLGEEACFIGDYLLYRKGENPYEIIDDDGKDILVDKAKAFQVKPLFSKNQHYNFFLLDQEKKDQYTVFDANEVSTMNYSFDELQPLDIFYQKRYSHYEKKHPILRKVRKKEKIGCFAAVPNHKKMIYLAPKYTEVYYVLENTKYHAIFLVKHKTNIFWVDPKGNKIWDNVCTKALPKEIQRLLKSP
ncbi:MAG: hypothetical protein MK212_09035 [Saprospiraceae bacterium]|nr:hypothetical protein [Saprospiraceae bacterium]